MKEQEAKEFHVVPYIDGSKYKNGKPKTKWVIMNEDGEFANLTPKSNEGTK